MKLWPKALVRKIRFHDLRHHADIAIMPTGPDPLALAGAVSPAFAHRHTFAQSA